METEKNSYTPFTESVGFIGGSIGIGVIHNGNEIFLVDSGLNDDDGKKTFCLLKELFPHKDITRIYVTHAHSDHCGGCPILKKLTDCTIHANSMAQKIMEFPESVASMYYGGFPFREFLNNSLILQSSCECDDLISEGVIFDSDKIQILAVNLRGHFYHDMGFLVTDKAENKKIFFLGDAFFGKKTISKFWIPFIYEPEEFKKSIHKIMMTEADFYVPSHGGISERDDIDAIAELNLVAVIELEKLIMKTLKTPMQFEKLLKSIADFSELKMKYNQWILIGTTIKSYLSSMKDRKLVDFEISENQMIWFSCN